MRKIINFSLLGLFLAFIYWNGLEGNRRTVWLDQISATGSEIAQQISIWTKAGARKVQDFSQSTYSSLKARWQARQETPPPAPPAPVNLEKFKQNLKYARKQKWAETLLTLQHRHPATRTETGPEFTTKTLEFGNPEQALKLILKIKNHPSKIAVEEKNLPFDGELSLNQKVVFQFNGLLEQVANKPDKWHQMDMISAEPGPWEAIVKQEALRYNKP